MTNFERDGNSLELRDVLESDAEAICNLVTRSIRELCTSDHKNIPETLELWLKNKTTQNFIARIRSARNINLACYINDNIAGYSCMATDGHITLNYVSPDFRSCGVSTALLVKMHSIAVELGNSECYLESTATAYEFYLSRGYRMTGPKIDKFGISAIPMNFIF